MPTHEIDHEAQTSSESEKDVSIVCNKSVSPWKNHLIAFLGEFFGTFIFLWTGFIIVQIANQDPTIPQNSSASDP